MDDYTDDFDDFGDGDFCNDDDYANDDCEDPLGLDDGDLDDDWCDEDGAVSDGGFNNEGDEDHFTWEEAFFIGGAMGWAYEEGIRNRKKRLKKKFTSEG